jgi:hypothetical protein
MKTNEKFKQTDWHWVVMFKTGKIITINVSDTKGPSMRRSLINCNTAMGRKETLFLESSVVDFSDVSAVSYYPNHSGTENE